MKKKLVLFTLIFALIINFAGCTNIVKSYETNERSKYINEKAYNGGKNTNKDVQLKKVWLNDVIGDNKIILDFSYFENAPKYKLTYSERNKVIKLFLKNTTCKNVKVSDAFEENKLIESIKVRESGNANTLIMVYLNKEKIEYRVDESNDTNQVVVNIRG